ncbi:LysR substrate-binding domain-containing protein [Streptomyces sp. NPDC055775]
MQKDLAGEVDAVTTWLPVREPDLTVGVVLREEPLNLMVCADHPLARQESVSTEVLGDHIVPRLHGPVPAYWEAAVLPARTPVGRPVRRGPAVTTFYEILALVAAGDAVCTVPDEGRRYNAQTDVVHLPLHDAPPVQWALIWRTDRATPACTRTRPGGDGLRGFNHALEMWWPRCLCPWSPYGLVRDRSLRRRHP